MRFLLICAALAASLYGQGPARPVTADRVTTGAGAPAAGLCAAVPDRGKVYMRRDAAAANASFYVCVNTTGTTTAWELQGSGGSGTVTSVTCNSAASCTVATGTTTPVVTVTGFDGVAVTGTPSSGQVPTATAATTATWQTPSGGASPAGSAGDIQTQLDPTTFGAPAISGQLADFRVVRTSDTVLTIGPACSATVLCAVSIGNNSYNGQQWWITAPATVAISDASFDSAVNILLSYDGIHVLATNAANAAKLSCSGCTVINGQSNYSGIGAILVNWSANDVPGVWNATFSGNTPASPFLALGGIGVAINTNIDDGNNTQLGAFIDIIPGNGISWTLGGGDGQTITLQADLSAPILSGTTGSIGGGLLTAACASGTATVTGITNTMALAVAPAADPGTGVTWGAFMSGMDQATVRVCTVAAITPTATTYNVRAIP